MTQADAILAYLKSNPDEGLTALQALRLFGTMRLAARIADLKAAGHVIHSESVVTLSQKRVARYRLVA